jgi:hypothetical protein
LAAAAQKIFTIVAASVHIFVNSTPNSATVTTTIITTNTITTITTITYTITITTTFSVIITARVLAAPASAALDAAYTHCPGDPR